MGKIKESFTEYPKYIIVPEGYWTMTATIKEEDTDKYWHNREDNEN